MCKKISKFIKEKIRFKVATYLVLLFMLVSFDGCLPIY